MKTLVKISNCWKVVANCSLFTITFTLLTGCHSGQKNEPVGGDEVVAATEQPGVTATSDKKDAIPTDFFSKGTIESVSEVAVTSRINEQIVMLGVEMGQRVQKGQVVARLDRTATEDRIVKARAELERAEYQYQNILMGQGYKRGAFDQAPETIREMARINSGYNTAKAALRQMEHQLTYCTIQAPISGVVTQLNAVLYSAAVPGETLFRIVDTEHLKVCFDILENELQRLYRRPPLCPHHCRQSRGGKERCGTPRSHAHTASSPQAWHVSHHCTGKN